MPGSIASPSTPRAKEGTVDPLQGDCGGKSSSPSSTSTRPPSPSPQPRAAQEQCLADGLYARAAGAHGLVVKPHEDSANPERNQKAWALSHVQQESVFARIVPVVSVCSSQSTSPSNRSLTREVSATDPPPRASGTGGAGLSLSASRDANAVDAITPNDARMACAASPPTPHPQLPPSREESTGGRQHTGGPSAPSHPCSSLCSSRTAVASTCCPFAASSTRMWSSVSSRAGSHDALDGAGAGASCAQRLDLRVPAAAVNHTTRVSTTAALLRAAEESSSAALWRLTRRVEVPQTVACGECGAAVVYPAPTRSAPADEPPAGVTCPAADGATHAQAVCLSTRADELSVVVERIPSPTDSGGGGFAERQPLALPGEYPSLRVSAHVRCPTRATQSASTLPVELWRLPLVTRPRSIDSLEDCSETREVAVACGAEGSATARQWACLRLSGGERLSPHPPTAADAPAAAVVVASLLQPRSLLDGVHYRETRGDGSPVVCDLTTTAGAAPWRCFSSLQAPPVSTTTTAAGACAVGPRRGCTQSSGGLSNVGGTVTVAESNEGSERSLRRSSSTCGRSINKHWSRFPSRSLLDVDGRAGRSRSSRCDDSMRSGSAVGDACFLRSGTDNLRAAVTATERGDGVLAAAAAAADSHPAVKPGRVRGRRRERRASVSSLGDARHSARERVPSPLLCGSKSIEQSVVQSPLPGHLSAPLHVVPCAGKLDTATVLLTPLHAPLDSTSPASAQAAAVPPPPPAAASASGQALLDPSPPRAPAAAVRSPNRPLPMVGFPRRGGRWRHPRRRVDTLATAPPQHRPEEGSDRSLDARHDDSTGDDDANECADETAASTATESSSRDETLAKMDGACANSTVPALATFRPREAAASLPRAVASAERPREALPTTTATTTITTTVASATADAELPVSCDGSGSAAGTGAPVQAIEAVPAGVHARGSQSLPSFPSYSSYSGSWAAQAGQLAVIACSRCCTQSMTASATGSEVRRPSGRRRSSDSAASVAESKATSALDAPIDAMLSTESVISTAPATDATYTYNSASTARWSTLDTMDARSRDGSADGEGAGFLLHAHRARRSSDGGQYGSHWRLTGADGSTHQQHCACGPPSSQEASPPATGYRADTDAFTRSLRSVNKLSGESPFSGPVDSAAGSGVGGVAAAAVQVPYSGVLLRPSPRAAPQLVGDPDTAPADCGTWPPPAAATAASAAAPHCCRSAETSARRPKPAGGPLDAAASATGSTVASLDENAAWRDDIDTSLSLLRSRHDGSLCSVSGLSRSLPKTSASILKPFSSWSRSPHAEAAGSSASMHPQYPSFRRSPTNSTPAELGAATSPSASTRQRRSSRCRFIGASADAGESATANDASVSANGATQTATEAAAGASSAVSVQRGPLVRAAATAETLELLLADPDAPPSMARRANASATSHAPLLAPAAVPDSAACAPRAAHPTPRPPPRGRHERHRPADGEAVACEADGVVDGSAAGSTASFGAWLFSVSAASGSVASAVARVAEADAPAAKEARASCSAPRAADPTHSMNFTPTPPACDYAVLLAPLRSPLAMSSSMYLGNASMTAIVNGRVLATHSTTRAAAADADAPTCAFPRGGTVNEPHEAACGDACCASAYAGEQHAPYIARPASMAAVTANEGEKDDAPPRQSTPAKTRA